MSAQSVKAKEVRIQALEEELEKATATAKRCRDDIKSIRKEQRKEILNPNQGELKLTAGKKKATEQS
ncbi:MAG TPA: hypothetical protein VJX71_09800 [Methylomirabilota bacterium]|nr:hypothetical protein [Methylomirabilota bacterium]